MQSKVILFVLLSIITVVFTGCISDEPAQLAIESGHIYIQPGQTSEITAVAKNKYGMDLDSIDNLTWSVEGSIGELSAFEEMTVVFTAYDSLGSGKIVAMTDDLIAEVAVDIVDEIPDPLVWEDSFESGNVGDFPLSWTINDIDYHINNETGTRVDENVPNIPDGNYAVVYSCLPREAGGPKAEMSIYIPVIEYGRLEFSVFQPIGEGSNFGIKPYRDDERLIDFWLSAGGSLRLPEKDGEPTDIGSWVDFAFEWNWDLGKLHVFQKADNNWVQKSPAQGYTLPYIPNRLSIDGGTVEGRSAWGAVDNLKLYDLSIDVLGN